MSLISVRSRLSASPLLPTRTLSYRYRQLSSTSQISKPFPTPAMASVTLPQNDKAHHIGTPPTHFKNPWPSFKDHGVLKILSTRFRSDRNFVPVPTERSELVAVRKATFGHDSPEHSSRLKATWLGHASWLIEFPALQPTAGAADGAETKSAAQQRGVTFLLDPVFADRTSPVSFLGPKRYSPLPCSLSDLPPVDAVLISHNHFDHLDIDVIKNIHKTSPRTIFMVPLKNRAWFLSSGIHPDNIFELDWWDALRMDVFGVGSVSVVCTPAQHASARTGLDKDASLWSGWALGAAPYTTPSTPDTTSTTQTISIHHFEPSESSTSIPFSNPKLYFTGDTGYRSVPTPFPTDAEEASADTCPAFAQIGSSLGPFDLALVPIGLYSPRDILSSVHCSPDDAVCVHVDVQAKKSVGMHWGTFRGGISGQFEDVREPPKRFKLCAEKKGLKWGEEIGVCEIGETTVV